MAMAATVQEIPLGKISPGPNDRKVFAQEALQELADSIERDGLAQPITVRPVGEGFEIVAGERRFRAHQLLGRKSIPALIREMSDEEASRIMLAENLHRKDLSPIEEAKSYQARMDRFGLTVVEVALWAGVSPDRVQGRVDLLTLREDVQHLVATGNLGIGHAAAMVGLDSNRQGLALEVLKNSERQPTVAEFRRVCGELRVQQAQDAMFDPDAFMVVQEFKAADTVKKLRVSIDPRLPEMKGAMTVGQAMAKYIEQLQQSEDPHQREAARVAGTIFVGLMKSNLCGPKVRPE